MIHGTAETLVDLLELRAGRTSEASLYIWVEDGKTTVIAYGELSRRAKLAAVRLLDAARPGDRVVLFVSPGPAYIFSLFGCIYAGLIPVPAFAPRGRRGVNRLKEIIEDASAALAVCDSELGMELGESIPATMAVRDVVEHHEGVAAQWRDPMTTGESLALLQYTSGSTGTPNGVMITHRNLIANCSVIHQRFGHGPASRGLVWLPPYHDMGLIGGILTPLFSGMEVVLMPPVPVVRRPISWLEAIAAFGATVSGAPNFAYELCIRTTTPEQRARLDLSSWKLAFTGAEPVRAETIRRFSAAFAVSGFDPAAFYPCYGLAEATLYVSGEHSTSSAQSPPSIPDGGRAEAPRTRTSVSCGRVAADHEMLIVDPDHRVLCSDGDVGEVWLAGPSVARGYWRKPELSNEVFGARLADGRGPYLRTGDLGLVQQDRLYVTGRRKDLVILRGRNHYFHDIENTAARSHDAVRPGGVVAFAIDHEGQERLVLIVEIQRHTASQSRDILASLHRHLADEHDVGPDMVLLTAPGTVIKTTSGKVQRFACREAFLRGDIRALVTEGCLRATYDPLESDCIPSDSLSALSTTERTAVIEAMLRRFVAQRIGCEPDALERDRSLGELGLDSLGLIGLQHQCERLGTDPPSLSELLGRSTTLWSLAQRVAADLDRDASVQAVDLAEPELALNEGQKALWIEDRIRGARGGHCLARAFTIEGPVQPTALRRAFARLISRHASLRACFPERDGVPSAVDRGNAGDWYEEIDARSWKEDALRSSVSDLCTEPLDLFNGPLFRVTIFTRANAALVLLVRAHHIIMDFESLGIVLSELALTYADEIGRPTRVLPLASAGPGAFAALERAQACSGSPAAAAVEFWQSEVGNGIAQFELPAEAPRRLEPGRGGRISFDISEAMACALRASARANQLTPFVLLATAWATLLHRWSGQPELVVGCPISNRPSWRFAHTVGFFVNVLPLRFSFADDPALTALLARTQARWVQALAHRCHPFSRVLESLGLGGRGPGQPFFQTLVSVNSAIASSNREGAWISTAGTGRQAAVSDLILKPIELPPRHAQAELVLSVADGPDDMPAAIEYDAHRYSSGVMQALAEQYLALLATLTERPEHPVSRVPLGTREQRDRALREHSAGPAVALAHETVEGWWSATVRDHAARQALAWHEGGMTFRELDEAANAVAAQLADARLEPEEPVGLLAERAPETVIGMLGILKAGGTFVPIDPTIPPDRAARLLAAAAAHKVLAPLRVQLDPRCPWPTVHRIDPRSRHRVSGRRVTGVTPRSAAYIIFTSGSTGAPKGVVVEHAALCNLVLAQTAAFAPKVGDRILQWASFSFDASISEVFVTLLSGATLWFAEPGRLLIGAELTEALASGVTAVTLPPNALALLDADAVPGLATVVSAGETCPDALVRRWAGSGRRFINAYGPTEATVCATLAMCEPHTRGAVIGRPIANVRVFVLDPNLEPVPPLALGEIYIGGRGLARGYLASPDLTAERFIPTPFGGASGARLYRTGDHGRWLLDGSLQFVGRIDGQVKIRGVRVETGEIEAVLCAHPAVRECAVTTTIDPTTEERRLIAFVCGPIQSAAVEAELRMTLRMSLPEAMVPSAFLFVESLPRTVSGKIDRAVLRNRSLATSQRRASLPPKAGLERIIAEVWADVLGTNVIDPHMNFFDAGATSLTAARVHVRLQERLGREFPLLDLFVHSTVNALARSLEPRDGPSPRDTSPAAALRGDQAKTRRTLELLRRAHPKHT